MEHEHTPQSTTHHKKEPFSNLSIQHTILLSAVIIAVSIFFSRGPAQVGVVSGAADKAPSVVAPGAPSAPSGQAGTLKPISKDDHIRGSLSAPIVIVEFSDPECPFCKSFHQTMQQVMSAYGSNGKVAWIYRHFPIAGLHRKAVAESQAIECASVLGGNDKFWQYLDEVFKRTNSNDSLDPAELPKIAGDIGLNVDEFNACVASGKTATRITEDMKDGSSAGVNGTPHSILINTKTGKKTPINGAVPFSVVQAMIEEALAGK
jgi:protein-disulfide isomerase